MTAPDEEDAAEVIILSIGSFLTGGGGGVGTSACGNTAGQDPGWWGRPTPHKARMSCATNRPCAKGGSSLAEREG